MKNFLKKILGIDYLIQQKAKAEELTNQALQEAELAEQQAIALKANLEEQERLSKLSPKDRATAKGEPWVSVLDVKINADNPRNGFFELDWNEFFVLQLKQAGYGFDGDPDEEIVDRWFRDLARNILGEEGLDTTRGAGYINVIPISQGKSEVS